LSQSTKASLSKKTWLIAKLITEHFYPEYQKPKLLVQLILIAVQLCYSDLNFSSKLTATEEPVYIICVLLVSSAVDIGKRLSK
jgi:hypothetical protein